MVNCKNNHIATGTTPSSSIVDTTRQQSLLLPDDKDENDENNKERWDLPLSFPFFYEMCAFSTLLALRATQCSARHAANRELQRRLVVVTNVRPQQQKQQLPIECWRGDQPGGNYVHVNIQRNHSVEMCSREALVHTAVRWVDKVVNSIHDAGIDYDPRKAKQLLHDRGYVQRHDFVNNNNNTGLSRHRNHSNDPQHGITNDVWSVKIDFGPIVNSSTAWKLANSMISTLTVNGTMSRHILIQQGDKTRLRQCVFGLLIHSASWSLQDPPSSVLSYANLSQHVNHFGIPQRSEQSALLFAFSGNQKFQLDNFTNFELT